MTLQMKTLILFDGVRPDKKMGGKTQSRINFISRLDAAE